MEKDRIFPDNWKEIIRGKKVILYNTGVSSLLGGREKRIEKMKWVFQLFKAHPEVVLWWRPHPLEISTLQSMLPELEEQYMEVRQQYIEENIGILDESEDLNRAIAISDAYYGAWSSVTELYRAVGKPVLYENNGIKKADDTVFLPTALCIKGEDIWFIQFRSNKLVRIDKNTYEVKNMVSIPGEPPFKERLYNCHLIDGGNSLFVLLEKSRKIYEYEIETDIIRTHTGGNEKFKFCSEIVIEKKHQLFMFPYENNDIWEYDCHTNVMKKRKFGEKKIRAARCCGVDGSKVYVADYDSSILYRYDFADQSCTAVKVGADGDRYWGVKKSGRYLVMLHLSKREIILWDEKTGETIKLIDFPENYTCFKGSGSEYLDMFEKNGKLYIFPFFANMILKVDIERKVITQAFPEIYYDTDYDEKSESVKCETYLCAVRDHDRIYAYAAYNKCWDVFDLGTETLQSRTAFEMMEPKYKQQIECILDENVYEESFCEGEKKLICTLENYIKNLHEQNIGNVRRDVGEYNIGTCIYNTLISEL